MVSGWGVFTKGDFTLERIDGNHLWPLDTNCKCIWLKSLVDRLENVRDHESRGKAR